MTEHCPLYNKCKAMKKMNDWKRGHYILRCCTFKGGKDCDMCHNCGEKIGSNDENCYWCDDWVKFHVISEQAKR